MCCTASTNVFVLVQSQLPLCLHGGAGKKDLIRIFFLGFEEMFKSNLNPAGESSTTSIYLAMKDVIATAKCLCVSRAFFSVFDHRDVLFPALFAHGSN